MRRVTALFPYQARAWWRGVMGDRLAAMSVEFLVERATEKRSGAAAFVGIREGKLKVTPFSELAELMDLENQRPRQQWWRALATTADLLSARPHDQPANAD